MAIIVSASIAFGSGARPALQSVAAASVEPVVSGEFVRKRIKALLTFYIGEILSAISMIQSIAALTSPILLGYFASRYATALKLPDYNSLSL